MITLSPRTVRASVGLTSTLVLVLSSLTTFGATAMAADTNGVTPGTVVVVDYGDDRVVALPPDGGAQVTIGGSWDEARGVAVDAAGDVFVTDDEDNLVTEIPADGSPEITIGRGDWSAPQGIAVDAHGDLFVANREGASVVEIPAHGGAPIDIAGDNTWIEPQAVAVDAAGDVFVVDPGIGTGVTEVAADGGALKFIGSGWLRPEGLAVDAVGNVYVADAYRGVVEVPADGGPQKTIGKGLTYPYDVALDSAGDVYVAAEGDNTVVEVAADGAQTTLASSVTKPTAIAFYEAPLPRAATSTSLHVAPGSLRATVVAEPESAGVATGTVRFSVDGANVGSVALVDGTATVPYAVPTGTAHTVLATYFGALRFAPSSASTTRRDPVITAQVTSESPETRFGWHRSPVHISFTCTTQGAALQSPCPRSITLRRDQEDRTVRRTIRAVDGGVGHVAIRGISIDQTPPQVRVAGAKDGAVYTGRPPTVRLVASDGLSGIARSDAWVRTTGRLTHYRLMARDKAGNVATITGSFSVRS